MKTVSWRDVLIPATAAAASTVLPAAALDAEEALLSEVDGPDWRLDEHLRCVMNASTSFFGLRLRPLASRARGPDPEAQGLDRHACWSSAWPAPHQIDQAWITDPMFAKSEHPIVIEAPEEVLQIRLQYPSDLAASNDLIGEPGHRLSAPRGDDFRSSQAWGYRRAGCSALDILGGGWIEA